MTAVEKARLEVLLATMEAGNNVPMPDIKEALIIIVRTVLGK